MPEDPRAPDEISAILEAFAQRRAPETAERPTPEPAPTLAWQTLVESNLALTRVALDGDGALILQCLSAIKRLRGLIHIPPEAFPVLRALLDAEGA